MSGRTPDGAPVVRWDAARGWLVDEAGRAVTRAQEAKARAYVTRGLVHHARTLSRSRDAVENEWHVHPLPGCRTTHVVRTAERRDGVGVACDCQAARGTRALAARACSHALAVRATLHRLRGGANRGP